MQKTSLTSRLAGLATLALAALPMAALSTAAQAAPATVAVKDLNLLTAQGNAALKDRIDAAAFRYCAERKAITDRSACRSGVRAELNHKADRVRSAQQAALTHSYAAR
ncbi:UrcA family protein [Phenylobacterium sp. VNQ135]|uniref:UrcA family protein n=1 Tax=Phenylobacterium sp. VNQ135 TaxID=3400922 RepID=UPI003BFBCFAC